MALDVAPAGYTTNDLTHDLHGVFAERCVGQSSTLTPCSDVSTCCAWVGWYSMTLVSCEQVDGVTVTLTPTSSPCPDYTPCGCECCGTHCFYQYQLTYDCSTATWGTPTVINKQCSRDYTGTFGARDGWGTWVAGTTSGNVYSWTTWLESSTPCDSSENSAGCPADPGLIPPAHPATPTCCTVTALWQTTWDCAVSDETWSTPTLLTAVYDNSVSPTGWTFESKSGSVVTYRKWVDTGNGCVCGSGTGDTGSAPATPSGAPSECDCPDPSGCCDDGFTVEDDGGGSNTYTYNSGTKRWDGAATGTGLFCDVTTRKWVLIYADDTGTSNCEGTYTVSLDDWATCPPTYNDFGDGTWTADGSNTCGDISMSCGGF
jgi:hypothetical protein